MDSLHNHHKPPQLKFFEIYENNNDIPLIFLQMNTLLIVHSIFLD